MARNYSIDQGMINRRIAEGRGLGTLASYIPWTLVPGTPSSTTQSREKGVTTGREHHLLSPLASNYFHVVDWLPSTIDCQESFPLLPIEETIAYAKECDIEHPSRPSSTNSRRVRYYEVLTTSFLLTVRREAEQKQIAHTIIYSADLEKPSFSLIALEVQRRYWAERDVEWAIVTERNVPAILAKNLNAIHKRRWIHEYVSLPPTELLEVANDLTRLVQEHSDESLRKVALRCDETHILERGTCLDIAKYLIVTRQWKIDLARTLFDPAQPLQLLEVQITPLDRIADQRE